MNIKKLLKLAKKTGDRLIVHDSEQDLSFVILDLDKYQELVDSQKDWDKLEEVISINNKTKINHDVSISNLAEPVEIIDNIADELDAFELQENQDKEVSLNTDFYATEVNVSNISNAIKNENRVIENIDIKELELETNNSSKLEEVIVKDNKEKGEEKNSNKEELEKIKNIKLEEKKIDIKKDSNGDKKEVENLNTDWFSAGKILKNRYTKGNGAHKDYKSVAYQKRVAKKPFYNKVHLDVGNDSVFFDEPI